MLPANPKHGLCPARAGARCPELGRVSYSTQGHGLRFVVPLVWPGPGALGGQFLSVPHLKTRNSKAAGIAGRRSHRHHERTVRYVLLVELHRHLVVTWAGREHEATPGHGSSESSYAIPRLSPGSGTSRQGMGVVSAGQGVEVGVRSQLPLLLQPQLGPLYLAPGPHRPHRTSHPCGPRRRSQPCLGPPQQWPGPQHQPPWSRC